MDYTYENIDEANCLLRPLGFELVPNDDGFHYTVGLIDGRPPMRLNDHTEMKLLIVPVWDDNEVNGRITASFIVSGVLCVWIDKKDADVFYEKLCLYIETVEAINRLQVAAVRI